MSQTKKQLAKTIKAKAHDQLIETRAVLLAMGYRGEMKSEDIASTLAMLALESQELRCHKEVSGFFQRATTAAESNVVQELLRKTAKSRMYRNSKSDGALMRSALRKENLLKARVALGRLRLDQAEKDIAQRRALFESIRNTITKAKQDTMLRHLKEKAAPSEQQKKYERKTLEIMKPA